MKLLPEDRYYNDIIPINIIYDKGKSLTDDNVCIVYKDLATGEKSIQMIHRPEMEVYIVKPEHRNYTHIRNFFEKDKCYVFRCHYSTRYAEIAREMKYTTPDEARTSPYVFGADMRIEQYYMMQFEYEYHTDAPKDLSLGWFDIENDIINLDRFPEYGETPINAVTYVDNDTKQVYTLVLTTNNMRELPKDHPKYAQFQDLAATFDHDMKWLIDHPAEFVEMCHKVFDDKYPGMEYNLLLFDQEINLIKAFWDIIHAADNDFISAWNLPYDIQNMMDRPARLGYDPDSIIPDNRFGPNRHVKFDEDPNPVVHKKKHTCITYTIPNFVDDMVNYAGIRSGGAKLASHKLNYVARKELKDEKLDYSESGNIRTFVYEDLLKFLLYNIKDVLLLAGISWKTGDMNTIYSRMYSSMILPKDSFTTTAVVWGSLTAFINKMGWTFGANKSKFPGMRDRKDPNYAQIVSNFQEDDSGDIYEELFFGDDSEDEDDDEEEGGTKKRKKYDGAFVANTLHMRPTGYTIMGQPAQYVHRNVGDQDITSEYPSAVVTGNMSNETLVGKVFLENPDEYNIPMYGSFHFRGSDLEDYKFNVSNFMMEAYSERDVFTFSNVFLGLPDPDDVFEELDDMIDELEG